MNELRLDYQNNAPFPWLGVGLLGGATVLLVLIGVYFVHLRNHAASLEDQHSRAMAKLRVQPASTSPNGVGKVDLAQEIKNANDVLHQLSVPWGALFNAVESSSGGRITLLALEPDIDRKQVKISGEASSYGAVMKYITRLEQQEVFGSVYPLNHDIQPDNVDKTVRFSLIASWRGQLL